MKRTTLHWKKYSLLFLFFGVMILSAVTAWGEESDLPPSFFEEEGSLPPVSFPEEGGGEDWNDAENGGEDWNNEEEEDGGEGWTDWEEDWNGSWSGEDEEGSAPAWEPWEEEEQDEPPDWGPEGDLENGPAFPEEGAEEEPSSVPPPSSGSASSKAPKKSASGASGKKTAGKGEREPSSEEVPEDDSPGILPRRVTEEDIPRKDPPLWYRGTDPNVLWIILVAYSMIILGFRILWNLWDHPTKRKKRWSYDEDEEDWE